MSGRHMTHNPSECLGQKVKECYMEGMWAQAPGSLSAPEIRSPFSVTWRSCSSGAWLCCCDGYHLRFRISSGGWSDPFVELVSSLEFVRELNAVLELKRHYINENCYSLLIKVKRFSCFILRGGKHSVSETFLSQNTMVALWKCSPFFVSFFHLSMYHPIIASSLPVSWN